MPTPIFSRRAEQDLLSIMEHIARDNITAAVEFVDLIEAKCQMLADTPDMGFRRDELLPNLWVWPVRNYLIFYQPLDSNIQIVRVLHGARDIPSQFE